MEHNLKYAASDFNPKPMNDIAKILLKEWKYILAYYGGVKFTFKEGCIQ